MADRNSVVSIVTADSRVRIRLVVDRQWEEKECTLEEARAIWWALGAACDFVEREGD
jgi:hypothetical protein